MAVQVYVYIVYAYSATKEVGGTAMAAKSPLFFDESSPLATADFRVMSVSAGQTVAKLIIIF